MGVSTRKLWRKCWPVRGSRAKAKDEKEENKGEIQAEQRRRMRGTSKGRTKGRSQKEPMNGGKRRRRDKMTSAEGDERKKNKTLREKFSAPGDRSPPFLATARRCRRFTELHSINRVVVLFVSLSLKFFFVKSLRGQAFPDSPLTPPFLSFSRHSLSNFNVIQCELGNWFSFSFYLYQHRQSSLKLQLWLSFFLE